MSEKLFSIIIPTYKGHDSLAIALMSLVKQKYKNFEVIISDDNGPKTAAQLQTQEVIENFKDKLKIKYLINEHVNGSHARNIGLKNASGDYIALLDDDDFYLENYLEDATKVFTKNPDIDFVFFNVAIVTKEGVGRVVKNKEISAKELMFGDKEIGTGSNLCFRKKVYEKSGGFDERYLRQQDIEFAVKKLAMFKAEWIDEIKIVKYFNQIDNYLNYEKSLAMHELLRTDMLEKGLLQKEEVKILKNKQLHILYNDMLAKGMNKEGVRYVYHLLAENNSLDLLDKTMYLVYCLSKSLFRIVFNIYLLMMKKNNSSEIGKTCLAYRNLLIEATK